MIIVCTFKHSMALECLIEQLESMGIGRQDLLAVPMNELERQQRLHMVLPERRATTFDTGMAAATASAVIFASFGFELVLGPIIWGLIGAFSGFIIGAGIHHLIAGGRRTKHGGEDRSAEVTIVIRCKEEKRDQMLEIIKTYGALTVGVVAASRSGLVK